MREDYPDPEVLAHDEFAAMIISVLFGAVFMLMLLVEI